MRADHLSLYGYPRPTSPNLDRFAADAWVFEDDSPLALRGAWFGVQWRPADGAQRAEVDAGEAEELRALGYL